jgi:hypothetical protein
MDSPAKSQPNEPSAWIFAGHRPRVETPGDAAEDAIHGRRSVPMVMHHSFKPTDQSEDFRRRIAMMQLCQDHSSAIGRGPHREELHPGGERGEGEGMRCVVLQHPWHPLERLSQDSLPVRFCGTIPACSARWISIRAVVPPEVTSRIMSHRGVHITFAEAQSFTGNAVRLKGLQPRLAIRSLGLGLSQDVEDPKTFGPTGSRMNAATSNSSTMFS